MNFINITVNVHCIRPSWVFQPQNEEFLQPIYRIYVDNDLYTERTWRWGPNTLINEEIWLDSGVGHSVRIEPVLKNPAQAKFKLTNFKIHNRDFTLTEVTILLA